MDFLSIKFFLFFFSSIVVIYLSPVRYRIRVAFPVLNAFFILTYINAPSQLWPLVVFLAAGFAGVRLVETWANRGIFLTALSVILITFVYLKKYTFISFAHFIQWPYLSVGLSYILFRMVQMLIDVYQKSIQERISPVSFFNFCCNFLTFVSGPIQRYQDYKIQEASLGQKALKDTEAFDCFVRMIHGLFKVVILSTMCLNYHKYLIVSLQGSIVNASSLWLCRKFILASSFYTLYLFFNFSGYMDIVISFGRLLGFQLPENFNRPFASRSFLELWSRWHITLADWFKFYVFNPFLSLLAFRWPNREAVPYLGVLAYFLTFFIMGLWHGSSWMFLIYGLFLGAGVSVNKLFDVLMRKYFSVSYNKMIDHSLSGLLGAAFTFMYFSMGLSCFWLDFNGLAQLMGKFKIQGFLVIFVLGGLIGAVVMFLMGLVRDVFDRALVKSAVLLGNFYFVRAWLSFELLMVIAFWFYGFGEIPDFVYKGF